MFDNYYWMKNPSLQLVADQLSRIASDLESEKETRSRSNDALLVEIKALRVDMKIYFHGDGEPNNPGILIRLDRLEQKQISRNAQMMWLWGVIGSVAAAFIGKVLYDFLVYYPSIAQ